MSGNAFAKMLDKAHENKSIQEIVDLSPAALQGVSEADAQALDKAFGIKTIGGLAANKFVLWAQALNTIAKANG
ncbi:MAG TPA: hypothetical protein VEB64_06410 [Azospirillaceae bacterium]|nr:hypothetical protein [Azospirillaceae bacterium]